MEEIRRIPFDFGEAEWSRSLSTLEDILSSGHWSTRHLNHEDRRTALLMRLLHIGGIAVYTRPYERREDVSPELRSRAHLFGSLMGKRDTGRTLIDIADFFAAREYAPDRTEYNALYFPELKAYVRCGGADPGRLLDLFEQEECDKVLLFPEFYGEDFFYAFMLVMPREDFLNAVGEERTETLAAMSEALHKAGGNNIIPSFPALPDLSKEE